MSRYNWSSEGPAGCDSHCIDHPCGPCAVEADVKNAIAEKNFIRRLAKFNSFREHLIIGQCFKVLGKKEIAECERFILDNEALDDDQFAEKANRWMLDLPKEQRPPDKKYNAMWALVSQCIEVKLRSSL